MKTRIVIRRDDGVEYEIVVNGEIIRLYQEKPASYSTYTYPVDTSCENTGTGYVIKHGGHI